MSLKDEQKFAWLKQLMEWQRGSTEFLDTVKVDLFSDEVYVFTPKGDVRVFPRGSTLRLRLFGAYRSGTPLYGRTNRWE